VVKPTGKKRVVTHLIKVFKLSERTACQLVGLSRTAYRYQPRKVSDEPLRARLKALAAQYPRYGYLLLHNFLKGEGLVINKKKTYRIYTEEKLQVRTKKRKKLQRPRLVMLTPSRINER
jgi:putative transposase